MSGGEYEPKDSRDVTRQQNTPGKPTDWRQQEAGETDKRGELEPDDSREVTAHQNQPGEPTGWRAKEGDEDSAAATRARAGGEEASGDNAARPPAGVPQPGRPFSAEEAAAADPKPG